MALTIMDVSFRWVLPSHTLKWNISKHDVIRLFEQSYQATWANPLHDMIYPKRVHVRNDNGSQSEANLVQQYLKANQVQQEFIMPATPQQNAHIESYHIIVESVICRDYDFIHFVACSKLIIYLNSSPIFRGQVKDVFEKQNKLKKDLTKKRVLILKLKLILVPNSSFSHKSEHVQYNRLYSIWVIKYSICYSKHDCTT